MMNAFPEKPSWLKHLGFTLIDLLFLVGAFALGCWLDALCVLRAFAAVLVRGGAV